MAVRNVFVIAILGLIFLLPALESRSQQLDDATETKLVSQLATIRLGDSESTLVQKIEPFWRPVHTNRFLGRHPFAKLLPLTNDNVISEWRSVELSASGHPLVLFAVFGSSGKTNLIDLLESNGQWVQPFVDGVYNRNVHGIRPGDSIQKVYTLLGKPSCEYSLSGDGKWQVEFSYAGYLGRFISIRADAGTGLVISVKDVTLD